MFSSDPSTAKPSVLVVEDDPTVRDVMVRKLRTMNLTVHEAADGDSAFDHLASAHYGLVISDIMLPTSDGVSILKAVDPMVSNTQVIMISGLGHLATAIQTLRLGAFDYLAKPFTLDELADCVQRALAKRRLNIARHDYQDQLHAQLDEFRVELDEQKEIFDSLLQTAAEAMVGTAHARDEATREHAMRVATLAEKMCRQLGLDDDLTRKVKLAAVLHDIGKTTVDEAILNKPRELTGVEYEQVKTHPVRAAELIHPIKQLDDVAYIVRCHHEWFDGSGYPDGLSGDDIPLGARVLSVADVYEALTTDRCYRPSVSEDEACRIILSRSGKQFDPWMVNALMDVLGRAEKKVS